MKLAQDMPSRRSKKERKKEGQNPLQTGLHPSGEDGWTQGCDHFYPGRFY